MLFRAVDWGALKARVPPRQTKGPLFESVKKLYGYVDVLKQCYVKSLKSTLLDIIFSKIQPTAELAVAKIC